MKARHSSHPIPEDTIKAVLTNAHWHAHTEITDVFLGLARQQHQQGVIDPDVQVALGILFYTNTEYDLAKDCFESALTVRPKVNESCSVFSCH
jgi:peroxin-5